jgi:hypothetical protein
VANTKISALTSASTPLAGTETLPIVQSSTTKQVTVANLTSGRAVAAKTIALTGASGDATIVDVNSVSVGGDTPAMVKLTSGGGGGLRILPNSGTSKYNWQIAAQTNVNNALEITPSTASGGSTFSTPAYTFSYDGTFTFNTGNLVQGTAAKGINFTANTPAAGMTSQLLNWYEEGTWTVTWTSVTGTPSNTTGYYTRIGRVVTFSYAAGANSLTGVAGTTRFTLPFSPGKYSAGSIASQLGTVSGSLEIDAGDFKAYPTAFSSTYMIFAGSYMI